MSDLERVAAKARETGRLGIDTEFMPEGRYRPLLCLVQIAVGEEVVVFDPIADELGDPAPLAAVLADPLEVRHPGPSPIALSRAPPASLPTRTRAPRRRSGRVPRPRRT